MCRFIERRIDTYTTVARAGLDELCWQAKSGLDSADQCHLLHHLHESENGHQALLPLLAEMVTAVRDSVREWNPNHQAAFATLDQAATHVADLTDLIATARSLLTPPARIDLLAPPDGR
ncbi:hypothetical protein [Streptomyces sp. NPDC003863]